MAVTIKDIAREANVSVSAVSYAINGNGSVSEEKKARILELVEKYQYRPNRVAQGLKSRTSRTIGVITDIRQMKLRARILEAIADETGRMGYTLLLINDTGDHEQAMHTLESNKVAGIIYLSYRTESFARDFSLDIPIVFAYCYDDAYANLCSLPDDRQAGYAATRHLIDRGHTRIGSVTGPRDWKAVRDRTSGYRMALTEAGIRFDSRLVRTGTFEVGQPEHLERNRRTAVKLLARDDRPTAVFAQSDTVAVAVYDAADELGLRIPEDLAVVGLGDEEFSRYLRPRLTSVSLPLREIGEQAAQMLLGQMGVRSRSPGQGVVQSPPAQPLRCELVVRGSS